jgi:hypothetical protein
VVRSLFISTLSKWNNGVFASRLSAMNLVLFLSSIQVPRLAEWEVSRS